MRRKLEDHALRIMEMTPIMLNSLICESTFQHGNMTELYVSLNFYFFILTICLSVCSSIIRPLQKGRGIV